MLERAVSQLQNQIYNLETKPVAAAAKEHSCFVKTTFKGTQSGKGASEAEAKANALRACDESGEAFLCEEKNVRCGS